MTAAVASSVLALTSCVYDIDTDPIADAPSGPIPFVFHISTLNNSTDPKGTDVIETVKSLRVIIIDNQGVLEVNENVDLEAPEYAAGAFEYIYSTTLNVNTKKVYLIANEEEARDFGITDLTDLPTDLPTTGSLTLLLDYFKEETEEDSERIGRTFEKLLNRIYFKADYSDRISDGRIYLPYSAYYELGIEEFGTSRVERPLYLVPAATKIEFNVVNYRRFGVQINDIELCSVHTHNYLLAQVGSGEKRKTVDDREMWWIDWLQQCAEGSHKAEDLETFNEKWGWMSGYCMPVEEPCIDRGLNFAGEEWKLAAMIDKNNPDRKSWGPFYLPESKNILPVDAGSEKQSYTLTFRIHDDSKDEDIVLSGVEIDTLKSLFRATHLILNVELYDQGVEIYAEIAPWVFQPFWGYVQQEDDD